MLFPFSFAVLRFPLPSVCLLVLSFSRFVFSITFAFSFRFPAPWWRNSSFVSVLHPPALLASLKVCVFPFACFLLSCFPASHLFIRSSLPFLFLSRFPFGCRWCHPVFSLWVLCGLLGSGFSWDSVSIYTSKFTYCIYIMSTWLEISKIIPAPGYALLREG